MTELFSPEQQAVPNTDSDWGQLEVAAGHLFTPHMPISEQELFAGRFDLIQRLIEVVFQAGQHAVLFGERGVGKSSLANILKEKIFHRTATFNVVKRNCTSNHDFKLIWQHMFSGFDYGGMAAEDWISQHHNPFDIYQLSEAFSSNTRPIFIIDEFDRVTDQATKVAMSDTIKYFSDYGAKATIILVGVARNVNELFYGHESITRNIDQIVTRKMTRVELQQLLETRLKLLNMSCDNDVRDSIVTLSQGLPGYTHLMGQAAARSAILRKTLRITERDLGIAIRSAIEKSDETIKNAYAKAIRSTKPQNQYRQALLACSLAQTDDRGYFSAAALRKPFYAMGTPKDIPGYARHLKEFCERDRGPVLIKEGTPKNYEYCFSEPLLRPYVVIRGVAEKLITPEMLN